MPRARSRSQRNKDSIGRAACLYKSYLGPDFYGPYSGARARLDYQHADGTVDITCWCERKIVTVTLSDVAAGQTRSCGRPTCHNPTNTNPTKE